MIDIIKPSLLQEVYMLYQVEPRKIPQEIPSTGEVIGYDIEYPEFTELKCYKLMKRLFDLGIRLDIDEDETYNILCLDNSDRIHPEFVFSEESDTLEECMLKVLLTLHDEILESSQQAIRDELEKEI